jgi:tripeptide aminopeptidase
LPLPQRQIERVRAAAASRLTSTVELATRICEIPAPTGHEHDRATFLAEHLHSRGYGPEIDDIGNVYVRRGRGSAKTLMLLAHTDTVFPRETSVSVTRDGDALRAPGIGDNSLGVAAMIETLTILDELELVLDCDILAVANVAEEGLGNLRGARTAVSRHVNGLGAVIAVEGHNLGRVTHGAVGSVRLLVTVQGPGGHSWGAFGTPSAIHVLSGIVSGIAGIAVPASPKTTFNVGIIQGGVSINTIAPQASAMVDMRSTDAGSLRELVEDVTTIARQSACSGITVGVDLLGERPAGMCPVDSPLVQVAADTLRSLGFDPVFDASSTDANIPISLGIPAICVGITSGGGGHTTREYIAIPPIVDGLSQLALLCIGGTSIVASALERQ